MLALKEGGRTTGVAYRLPDDTLEEELTLLWKREMITGCYLPTWCKLELDDGRTVNALVFIMDPRHPLFEPDTSAQVIAPLIARASGPRRHQRPVSVFALSRRCASWACTMPVSMTWWPASARCWARVRRRAWPERAQKSPA